MSVLQWENDIISHIFSIVEIAAFYKIEQTSETLKEASRLTQMKEGINRIPPQLYPITDNQKKADEAVKILDDAMNFHQSDYIAKARNNLKDLVILLKELGARNFNSPTRYGWQVVNRGNELFFESGVSCSVKHGTIILDSSNAGAQFYVNLLNILGAFAMETSEFETAKETFSFILTELHGKSDTTSHLRDLGAAYNNAGCLSLILGDFNQANNDFKNSLKHFKHCERQQQLHLSVNAMAIAVKSNISRLHLMSRHFAKGLQGQDELVKNCKTEKDKLPFQTLFMVMQNQAVLYSTLGLFRKAEIELKWLISNLRSMKREESDLLLNFVSLQLCEVLLLRGELEEADKVFALDALTSASVDELMPMFGGLHINVRMETFEKIVDVFVQSGKMKSACELMDKGLNIVRNVFGPDHFNVASLLYKEGSILKLMGDVSGSMKKLQDSAEILREIFGERHPLLITCYMSLGDVAFQLNLIDKSHLYFQRAMENVEDIHQVSFPNQLSMKYFKITRNSKNILSGMFQGRKESMIEEQRIEGLVAEYGQALAVLLSRLNVTERHVHSSRIPRTKGKHPLLGKGGNGQCSESIVIISQKCVRDLLQSGEKLLRHGMTREAVAFFQKASRYCQAHLVARAHPNASLARLFGVISQARLGNQGRQKKSHALKGYLDEATEIVANTGIEDGGLEMSSGDTEMLTFDSHFNLKLMLIFLILLSIQFKLYDITFAAYALYATISPNDGKFLLTLNHGLQVYASRMPITCNGATAVQDVIISTAIGGKENELECHISGKPLFKSLAYQRNVPSNSFLATFNVPFFLDIEDVKILEEKILRSFEEYLQIKTFESDDNAAIHIFVDLTSTSFDDQDILQTGSRIELLPLCLCEEGFIEDKPNKERNVSVIFPVMCQKTKCMTFADEPTSCFMFSRIGLWLVQECNSGKISTLTVQNQCIVFTVFDPVRARVTLWYEGKSIKEKVQLVRITEGDHFSDENEQKNSFFEDSAHNSSSCSTALERFFAPAVLTWANTREVRCEINVVGQQCSNSDEPQVDSCRPHGTLWSGVQPTKRFSQISSEGNVSKWVFVFTL